ncbi:MAG: FimV/HubP family polar landmark protein [Gammaproteobacteria bacterium]
MRALARWGITPLLAAPVGAWALGLGNIELKSALNQPFLAQIDVISATPDELQGLKVALAPSDMFTRYGLDRPAFLQNLEFRVVSDRSGRGVVQVTSAQSIAEPFVTLLVEATWPRGRVLREYTVLLDPPVLLPANAEPQAVQPAETRPATNNSGGAINRPAPQQPASQRGPEAAPPPVSRTEPEPGASVSRSAPPRIPASAPGGAYGPVQRGDTLWVIADRFKPEGVTVNQMMVATYRSNPDAFGGNINLLRAGASLHLPETTDFDQLTSTAANSEVQRQTDEWSSRGGSGGQLRLLPPVATEVASAPAPTRQPSAAAGAGAARSTSNSTAAGAANTPAPAPAPETRRPVEVTGPTLQNLQQQAASATAPPATAADGAAGVDLEKEQVFADDKPETVAPAATPPAAPAPVPVATGPSLVSQALDWVMSPLLWISLGVAALLLTALWFVRRRRQEQQEPEGITGRWEQLESEVADDQEREATERMRRQLPEQTIVVEEQRAERPQRADAEEERRPAAKPARAAAATPVEETLSNQTVINLDQADAVAEADFHMAYGLYDQAAELVQKALDASPNRRDLKLKLLEVFFVWGNKDSFLKAAHSLRGEIGQAPDADWDKVVIMGRQICPGEKLFTEATATASRVDVDLEAGDSPLDLAFDEMPESDTGSAMDDLGAALDFNLESTDERPAPKPVPVKPAARPIPSRDLGGDALDIGAQTAAGLEAALFAPDDEVEEVDGSDTDVGDALSVTQESPTIERARPADLDFSVDAPTIETPTIESPWPGSATSIEKVETPFRRREPPTIEQPALGGGSGEYTAEIDLDDLGLDVKDIEGLPQDLGDLPTAADGETDTRQQPALRIDDELLSATGVTKVLRDSDAEDDDLEQSKTSILSDGDVTLLAPGFGDGTLTGTEVLDGRFETDPSGDTSLVRALRKDDGIDLDLADLTQALHGADTVEQPRTQTFSREVFGGGDTPLDLDVGSDPLLNDEDPTGTEGASPLDPQTMTEVGTKLDLARAYIDMGDPEGARSILEEVLDEGDPNQRREAQSLIDVLTA